MQKVQVLLVDDLDRSKATETVTFDLDDASYEIDLSSVISFTGVTNKPRGWARSSQVQISKVSFRMARRARW
jgi:hypothetical protein